MNPIPAIAIPCILLPSAALVFTFASNRLAPLRYVSGRRGTLGRSAHLRLLKVIIDPKFTKVDDHTFQSPDYDSAVDKIEIAVKSAAGNVSVKGMIIHH